MKLFITGAASFVAAELKAQCRAKGIDVVGLDTVADGPGTGIADIRSDDLAREIPDNVDAVVHLAAVSRDPDCRRDPVRCYDVNVAGTVNVYEAAHARGARQLIFASTEWVYDGFEPGRAKCEDDAIDLRKLTSDYAISKLAAETALHARHTQTGMPVTVLRFGIIYGPRRMNWSAVEALLAAVATSDRVEVGARATARCFIHVTDIARGILACVGRKGYEVFNIQGDGPVTLGDVIDASGRLLGRRPRVVETNAAAPDVRNVSNAKALAVLGWRPQIGLHAGLATVADFLDLVREDACPAP
jgi:UDP-glucose 4-epimerase